MTDSIPPFPPSAPARESRPERYRLESVSDEALHAGVKTLTGRYNGLTADLLAHLAEVNARGIYRERACSSLYTYCVYELRLSEDEAQRRVRAARTARAFPALFEMLAEGAIHLTGLLLVAPLLTQENCGELLARARFRTKREIERLVAEVAPRPDVPARIEALGPVRSPGSLGSLGQRPVVANLWQAFTASLRGPVRELAGGVAAREAPPCVEADESEHARDDVASGLPALAQVEEPPAMSKPLAPFRYRVEFTASERYVELMEEARNLVQHQVPNRDIARVHELAMAAFVAQLRKRRHAATNRPRRAGSDGPAPARVEAGAANGSAPARVEAGAANGSAPARVEAGAANGSAPARVARRYVPAEIRCAVWQRDAARCTFVDSRGRRCKEQAGLEVHHEHAFALGGPTTLENLRLMCRAHNALHAERDFGRAHVERMRTARWDGDLRGPGT